MRYCIAMIVSALALECLWSGAAQAASTSPLTQLSDPEKSYYSKVFDYSMDNVQPGGKYEWASYSGKGNITLSEPFISKSGATCRNFSENFNVKGHDGIDKGVGCKRRGEEGWCKLDLSKAKTCSFEDHNAMFDMPNMLVPGFVGAKGGAVSGSGSSSGGDISSGADPNIENFDTGNTPHAHVTSKGYADTVTGNAGKAGAAGAAGGLSWFTSTFLGR